MTTPTSEAGYSLIEVIVVLMIFSLLAGIVGMNLRTPLQNVKYQTVQSDIIEIVELTRAQAANRGSFVRFDQILSAQLRDDNDAVIHFPQTGGAGAYGACLETAGVFELDGERYAFRVEPVTCQVSFSV